MDNGMVIALTTRAKQGDKEAFGQLYALIWRELYKFALYYLGSREDAEDAVQEAVIAAYRSLYKLREPEAFKGWMFRVLSNCCKKKLKAKIERRNTLCFDELEILSENEAISDEMHSAAELYDSLKNLSILERQIILLSVIAGYKSDEIACLLGKNASSIRSILSRSLKKLRLEI